MFQNFVHDIQRRLQKHKSKEMVLDFNQNPSSNKIEATNTNSLMFSGIDESRKLDISDISKNASMLTDPNKDNIPANNFENKNLEYTET